MPGVCHRETTGTSYESGVLCIPSISSVDNSLVVAALKGSQREGRREGERRNVKGKEGDGEVKRK